MRTTHITLLLVSTPAIIMAADLVGLGREGKLSSALIGPSVASEEGYISNPTSNEDNDTDMTLAAPDDTDLLATANADVAAVTCPVEKPLYCKRGKFCCARRFPICCKVNGGANKFCCRKKFPYCGKDGRCYAS